MGGPEADEDVQAAYDACTRRERGYIACQDADGTLSQSGFGGDAPITLRRKKRLDITIRGILEAAESGSIDILEALQKAVSEDPVLKTFKALQKVASINPGPP